MSGVVDVTPSGNGGLDWDTTNDLSVFSGLVITSLEISLGMGINYVAIDNLNMESVATVPEPTSFLLTMLAFGGCFLRRRVKC